MTRSQVWSPSKGWDAFTHGEDLEELAWEALAGWHYMNPTAQTSVWESPEGATVYLAFDDSHAVIELVIGHVGDDHELELTQFQDRLRRDFGLRPAGE